MLGHVLYPFFFLLFGVDENFALTSKVVVSEYFLFLDVFGIAVPG